MHLRDVLAKVLDLFVALELEGVLHAPLGGVVRDPVVVLLHDFDLGDGQTDAHERVEGDGDLVAVWAPHCALELPVHQVNDDGLISLKVILPRLFCVLLIVQTLRLNLRNNRLFQYPVQVFVQAV